MTGRKFSKSVTLFRSYEGAGRSVARKLPIQLRKRNSRPQTGQKIYSEIGKKVKNSMQFNIAFFYLKYKNSIRINSLKQIKLIKNLFF